MVRYLDHVNGLDDAGGEHPGGPAVNEGLDRLPDAGGGRRRRRRLWLLLLLRVRHPHLRIGLRSARLGSARGAEGSGAGRRRSERGGESEGDGAGGGGLDRWVASRFINAIDKKKKKRNGCCSQAKCAAASWATSRAGSPFRRVGAVHGRCGVQRWARVGR